MLQLNVIMCAVTAKLISRIYWRQTALFATASTSLARESPNLATKITSEIEMHKEYIQFKSLKVSLCDALGKQNVIARKIETTKSLNEILQILKLPTIPSNDMIKITNILVKFTNMGTNKKIETFNKEILQKNNVKVRKSIDYSTFYDLSTAGMIQEIYKFANLKQRDPNVLKYLFENINEYNDTLSYKQCSCLLYSMSALNYYDEKLLNKISSNLIDNIHEVSIHSLHSILKSLTFLKYKNSNLLLQFCDKIINSTVPLSGKCIANILISFAQLGYDSEQTKTIIEMHVTKLSKDEVEKDEWLNIVWSLLVLNNVSNSQVESVLNEEFVKPFLSTDSKANIPRHLKLLNINGAAKYILNDYNGQLLDNPYLLYQTLPCPERKVIYVSTLKETLEHMYQSPYFKTNTNSKMGFLIDIECYMDSNFKPLNGFDRSNLNTKKIAILLHDYHAYCRGEQQLRGIYKLYERLLSHSGYHVLGIPYYKFGVEDKLVKRKQILEQYISTLT